MFRITLIPDYSAQCGIETFKLNSLIVCPPRIVYMKSRYIAENSPQERKSVVRYYQSTQA